MKNLAAVMAGLVLAAPVCSGGFAGAAEPVPATDAAKEAWKVIAPYFAPPKKYENDFGKHRPVLKFYDGKPVRTVEDWKRRREEIRAKWHKMMGPWPALIKKPKIEYVAKEKKKGYTQHTIKLQVVPGWDPWKSYLLIPEGKGPFPAVLSTYYNPEAAVGNRGPFGGRKTCDYARRLARRGFVTLSIGRVYDYAHALRKKKIPDVPYKPGADCYYPDKDNVQLQPSSFHAYVAANCYNALASLKEVDPKRVGIVGHSYGGKWAMFGAMLSDKFACGVFSDPGITIFNPRHGGANYERSWYLGARRKGGSAYRQIRDGGHDLHELLALMAPRPFLISGCQGTTDKPVRWQALNHVTAVNKLLGRKNRVAMSNNRPGHGQTSESLKALYAFFEYFLKHGKAPGTTGGK